MISSVKGHFSKIAGSLAIDESGHANSHVEVTMQPRSKHATVNAMRT